MHESDLECADVWGQVCEDFVGHEIGPPAPWGEGEGCLAPCGHGDARGGEVCEVDVGEEEGEDGEEEEGGGWCRGCEVLAVGCMMGLLWGGWGGGGAIFVTWHRRKIHFNNIVTLTSKAVFLDIPHSLISASIP